MKTVKNLTICMLMLALARTVTQVASAAPAESCGPRFGIVTDCHYADSDTTPPNTRYYRDSLDKLADCVTLMNDEEVDFLIELGDFVDKAGVQTDDAFLSNVDAIDGVFQNFNGPTYHVLGNHDLDRASKGEFLEHVTGSSTSPSYYSFDISGLHCIVLDACYGYNQNDDVYYDYDHGIFDWQDTWIPPDELAWLEADLAATANPTIVFIHQPLVSPDYEHQVKNAAYVVPVLEDSGKVLAVFQGHYHWGYNRERNGIHYYTLKAMVEGPYNDGENNSYAIVKVHPDMSITVTGYGEAESAELESNFDLVAIDIKPGTCPNPLNVKSEGVLPVAIPGSEEFDVLNIDPTSIRLEGVAPIRSSYEDVATPVLDSEDGYECTTEGPDGYLDLTLKFKTQEIVAAVGEVSDGDSLLLILTGEDVDETPIVGADCVVIAKKGKEK